MKEIELYHLGDFCEPGIIINDILNDKKKLLFMLGNYNFNDIVSYLKDNDFEKIYDRNFFQINKNRNVRHSLYKFMIFTNFEYEKISIPNVYTIKLEHSYYEWYEMERDTKLTLYTEIYGRFIDCLCQNGVEHAFPKAFSVDSINLRV